MTDLDSLYAQLEEKVTEYKHLHDISLLFQQVRDEMHIQQKTDEERKAQWEIDIFNFTIEDDTVKPLFVQTNKEGKEVVYPSLTNFDENTYSYIIKRIESTKNPLLVARYSHILWLSPKKQLVYAQSAIDAYLQLIILYERKDKEHPNEQFGLDIIKALGNAVVIALKIKDSERLEKLKSEIRRLVFGFNPDSSWSFALRTTLIEIMLDKKQLFVKDDFKGINELLFSTSSTLPDKHQVITQLELGEKVDLKLETTSHNWKLLIAQAYEGMMQAFIKEPIVATAFCVDALRFYREIADTKKVEELEKIYSELKGKEELKEIKLEVDLTEHNKKCKATAKRVVQHTPEQILSYLIYSGNLFPKKTEVEEVTKAILKEYGLLGVIPTQVMDERGHTVQHFEAEEEIFYFRTLSQYQLTLESLYLPLIHEIIVQAINENKLSFSLLGGYLAKTWLGKELEKTIQGEKIKYNWLSLIMPSLLDFFNQLDYALSSTSTPNFVECIDSLTLKVEGIVRDLCYFNDITTFYQDKDNKKRVIYMERDLNALLHDPKISQLFDEDELFFFRFVLVEKAGYNLRHKVAHSLMNWWDYQVKFAHLLFLILLRLSRFKLEDARASEEKKD